MKDVAARRAELQAALQRVDQATPMNWADVKSGTDRDLDAYRSSVRTASSRIKAAPGRTRGTMPPRGTMNPQNPSTNPANPSEPQNP